MQDITLHQLEGTWFIQMTNFPMWLKGDKKEPTFNYTITEKSGKKVLYDVVTYVKNGKNKSIIGYDYPVDASNTSFVWRGKGILFFLKSKWKLIHFDEDQDWALIYFEKTLFTPEGYDVISRKEELPSNVKNDISKELDKRGIVLTSLRD